MPGSPLVEAEIEIVIRNADLEDIGEIRRYNSWQHTLKLNDVSSWQLDMHTVDFESYGIDENTGILFYRDGELLIDGPIMQNGIQKTLTAGEQKTVIIGGCDNAYLAARICYPVVTGPLFDTTTGNWRFGVQRSAAGVSANIIKGDVGGQEYDVPLVVDDAEGFLGGQTVMWIDTNGNANTNWNQISSSYNSAAITLSGVDFSTNTLTLAVPQQYPAILTPAIPGGVIYQTSGGIVDDPKYVGFDTRTGPADTVAKQLVYFNAGQGACSDFLGTRAIPHLIVGSPNSQGSVVTSNARGESLLTQVQNVCLAGGINFATKQVGDNLEFDTFIGNDLSRDGNLIFSVDSGNLKEYSYTYGPPTANMVWGCGPNTGPDKLMLPSGNPQSIAQYGRRESWVSSVTAQAGDSAAQIAANMVQTNNTALAQGIINGSITLTLQETDQVRYPRDFGLGDRISIVVGNTTVSEIVTTVVYSVPDAATAAGSALSVALTRSEPKSMQAQKATTKLLQTMNMA